MCIAEFDPRIEKEEVFQVLDTLEANWLTEGSKTRQLEEMLADVGIGDLMDRRPSDLSGGQQQRVAIARALVKGPTIVLADEPTANLDSVTAEEIMALMHAMNEKLGTTFVFSTHDPRVMNHATRLIKLRDGRVESDERIERGAHV